MIDFVFVSHVERMLASCAHWKGLDLRCDEMKKEYPGLNTWLDAFEMVSSYLYFRRHDDIVFQYLNISSKKMYYKSHFECVSNKLYLLL